MRQSYYELYIHIIWSTKNKEALINKKVENMIVSITKDK